MQTVEDCPGRDCRGWQAERGEQGKENYKFVERGKNTWVSSEWGTFILRSRVRFPEPADPNRIFPEFISTENTNGPN